MDRPQQKHQIAQCQYVSEFDGGEAVSAEGDGHDEHDASVDEPALHSLLHRGVGHSAVLR